MSRRYQQHIQVNQKVKEILEDPATLLYLGERLIGVKPRYVPQIAWNVLLSLVMNPETKQITIAKDV